MEFLTFINYVFFFGWMCAGAYVLWMIISYIIPLRLIGEAILLFLALVGVLILYVLSEVYKSYTRERRHFITINN
jgi:hypothetical protein